MRPHADPAPRTLWRDEARRRFYLVPDAMAPEPGALVLRAGAARRIEVGEPSVAPYEVTKDEARAFLDARLDGFVGGVKRSVEDALSRLGIPIPRSDVTPGASPSSPDAKAAASPASPASEDSGDVSPRAASSADAGPAADVMTDDTSSVDARPSASADAGSTGDGIADAASSSGESTGDATGDSASSSDLDSTVDGIANASSSSASKPLEDAAPSRDASSGDGSSGDATPGDATSGDATLGDAMSGDATPGEPGPGVRLFAALTGEAPEDVTNPEVLIRALRRLGDGAVEVARQALRGEEGKAAARARLRALGDTFREHGIPVPRGDSEP